jgi:hypothetical protein
MLREDRELLTDLKWACNQAGQFTLGYLSGDLSIEVEEAYALRLIHIGEQLLKHVESRKAVVLDGEPPMQFVIEGKCVRMAYEMRELPSGEQDPTRLRVVKGGVGIDGR